ncbi:hypothetical protein S7711_03228 [Stachybotrys chartarum IBT 7711]|uniref:Peptidase M4 C-terminal domain-containing protein n=1 Tax=Stachybotrys chartarum (strain CBS 109288 / IBT 7711) TaxID=1280523 RepID=A0A084AZK3_STACB|nr:hypothetical protein S7711_03228 [Stachybotrys chartarum IBT 7711]
MNAGIIPHHILEGIANADDVNDHDICADARATLDFMHKRAAGPEKPLMRKQGTSEVTSDKSDEEKDKDKDKPPKGELRWSIYDAKHDDNEANLPGKLARDFDDREVKDKAVNEAYENVGKVLDFYRDAFKWNSIDNKNKKVISTVHFGKRYENAFWDPERLQMVFGDGAEFLNNFTGCIDVIGHEISHAVTEYTTPLDYHGQSGALNEHISDVFGIMIKQKIQDEKADVADWLIGEECILPGIKGVALRSMKAPGKAYNDPRFGQDPQVGHMSRYETTFEDNGGVHVFSGIPNKAFQLAATAFGGYS